MHPFKKQKVDDSVASDPFDDEDDWDDDDDILQLVANDLPTNSQMSQAVKASPSNKSRTFIFKRPSASVVSTKPTSYVNSAVSDTSAVANALDTTSDGENSLTTRAINYNSGSKQETANNISSSMQMSDMIRKQQAHEGEIKWLRLTLKEKDTQINTMRSNFNAEKAKQKLQFSEKERAFVKDIESLRSELQFKESELVGVTQTLDRLKREKAKPPPALNLDSDGFPASTSVISSKGAAKKSKIMVKQVKAEPMETSEPESSHSTPSCDLLPSSSNRLVPRKLTIGEYQRKLLVSQTMKAKLENVKNGMNMDDRSQCLQLLTDCITCAKDLCYL